MTPPATLRALLAGVVDYAGLFPPARLDMEHAVARYATYRERPEAWLLGRFVVPLARIDEFIAARRSVGRAGDPWRLSVLVSAEAGMDGRNWLLSPGVAERVRCFNADFAGLARIESVEVAPTGLAELSQAAAAPLERVELFIEVTTHDEPDGIIQAIAALGALAKIRTGGVTADSFPGTLEVTRFLMACSRHDTAFKATAGLHHPIRGSYKLTYEHDAPVHAMFGFLNVFAAAALARVGADQDEVMAILETSRAEAFTFDAERLGWGERSVPLRTLREVRARFARSFGSCSFDEPIEDLRRLSLL